MIQLGSLGKQQIILRPWTPHGFALMILTRSGIID